MKGLLSGFKWLIDTITFIWNLINYIIKMVVMVIQYLIQVVLIVINYLTTLPIFLQSFVLITIVISMVYLILNRKGGTSD